MAHFAEIGLNNVVQQVIVVYTNIDQATSTEELLAIVNEIKGTDQ
jgi:hypothetical protein